MADIVTYADLNPSMSETDFQGRVMVEVAIHSWEQYHTYDSRKSSRGFPDLTLVHAYEAWPTLLWELKAANGRTRSEQFFWIDRISAGCLSPSHQRAEVLMPEHTDYIIRTLEDPHSTYDEYMDRILAWKKAHHRAIATSVRKYEERRSRILDRRK